MRITWDDAKDLSVHCLVTRHVAIRTMCLGPRSKLHPCDLTALHNQGCAKAENMILILPMRHEGPSEED